MRRAIALALLAAAGALAADPPVQTKFAVGGYAVNLMPSSKNVSPTVTFHGRSFMFAYRTDGFVEDGRLHIRFHSAQTNRLAVLARTPQGIRADYVHSLYVGNGEKERLVGFCSNEVVFADGRIDVRATMYPAEPGRYRFYHTQKMSQVIVFPGYADKWTGTTLHLVVSKDVSYINELTPHRNFDPEAWGMGVQQTGLAREMTFGNVPGVVRFGGDEDARFSANRYRGGFEANAAMFNKDVMHKPSWDGPVSFSYSIAMFE